MVHRWGLRVSCDFDSPRQARRSCLFSWRNSVLLKATGTELRNVGFTAGRKYRRAGKPHHGFYNTTGFREFPLGMLTRRNGVCDTRPCLPRRNGKGTARRHLRASTAAPTITCTPLMHRTAIIEMH